MLDGVRLVILSGMSFVIGKPLEMQDWLIFISESHTDSLHFVSLSVAYFSLCLRHVFFF